MGKDAKEQRVVGSCPYTTLSMRFGNLNGRETTEDAQCLSTTMETRPDNSEFQNLEKISVISQDYYVFYSKYLKRLQYFAI